MKVIILAGGLGTRLSEETENRPKPMVLIDEKPILWHIMNSFFKQGLDEFILALGYRSDVIKRWLVDLNDLDGDITIDSLNRKVHHREKGEHNAWTVTALETGLTTQTGGRISRCMKANVSIKSLVEFHEAHGKLATVTAVRPPARFGHLEIEGSQVTHFGEKTQSDAGWINGGYFVLEPEVADFVFHDDEPFETKALPRLVEKNQLMAYHHYDFWQPMDTLRERNELSVLAKETPPPWLRIDGTLRKEQ
jgi:glucose-1-phosphate cytidylyltransferase